jgi:hypothetical protein
MVLLSPTNSDQSVIVVTFGQREPGRDDLRVKVNDAAKERMADKNKVEIKSFVSKRVSGYYFSMVDRAPKAHEFKYLTKGMAEIGILDIAFTIITNEREEEPRALGLDLIQGAI